MVEKKKNFSIYFLQEMHSTRETEICWQSEWGYSTIFKNFSSSRAGVGILFNNNFYFQILKYFGAIRFQRGKIAAFKNISWLSHKDKALGVWLSTIKEESITLNYEEKKEIISKTLKKWQFRRLRADLHGT